MAKSKAKELKKIKSSFVSRGLSLAKLSINAGTQLALQSLDQAFKSPESKDKKWQDFLRKQTAFLTNELGELKGSLMKAGQLLSVYGEHFFPPEITQLLRTLQQDSPPVQWSVMERALIKHLGRKKRDLLEIEEEAIGTASLGQVHRARIKETGEVVALKIQYPNVEKAIDSDLKAMRSFLYLMKLFPKDFNTDPIFAEIREMLKQETDYVQEAERTQEYFEKLKGDSRFIVPRVYSEFSNKRVLTTSYEEGLRVDDLMVKNLPQDRRNILALNYMELFFKEIFEWQFVQTDPHFGNYKIRLSKGVQDQLVLFDFGATRKYSDRFMAPYHQMIKALYKNDREAFEKAAQQLSFLKENDDPGLRDLFAEFCFDIIEPFLHPDDVRNSKGLIDSQGRYDWSHTDLPQRSSKKIFKLLQNYAWRTPPREVIFLDRKAAGVFIFLAHLGAHIQGRELLESYLKKV